MKTCSKCERCLDNEAFSGRHSYCRDCQNIHAKMRNRKFKQDCIDYKGRQM